LRPTLICPLPSSGNRSSWPCSLWPAIRAFQPC